jgi:hypothetical protein
MGYQCKGNIQVESGSLAHRQNTVHFVEDLVAIDGERLAIHSKRLLDWHAQ